jgi:hypothetical protein
MEARAGSIIAVAEFGGFDFRRFPRFHDSRCNFDSGRVTLETVLVPLRTPGSDLAGSNRAGANRVGSERAAAGSVEQQRCEAKAGQNRL